MKSPSPYIHAQTVTHGRRRVATGFQVRLRPLAVSAWFPYAPDGMTPQRALRAAIRWRNLQIKRALRGPVGATLPTATIARLRKVVAV